MTGRGLEPSASDLAEASWYGAATVDPVSAARRQIRAHRRLHAMDQFYREHRCRMARLHMLTAAAVMLGRLCLHSREFDAMGDALMPVDERGEPRTAAWVDYREVSRAGRPWVIRDERWMVAHVADLEHIRAVGLEDAFYRASERYAKHPIWALLRQHMDATLGARFVDHQALSGFIPYESAIAQGLRTGVGRLLRFGRQLLTYYAQQTLYALWHGGPEREGLPSYRRTAWMLIQSTVTTFSTLRVYRRGLREQDRGRVAEDDAWPLLARVLGPRVDEVDPRIVQFYSNPSGYMVRALLELHTLPVRLGSWCLTLLLGQGLYETTATAFDARFRVYARPDQSMHFVRELYIGNRFRQFDSDFVVREVDGQATLFEIFVDARIEVEMLVEAVPDGGLRIRGRNLYWRGLRLPSVPLQIEFCSRVEGATGLAIDGYLLLQPRSRAGHFILHRVFRRPRQLGCIHYEVEGVEALEAVMN